MATLNSGDKIVFVGDSITEQGWYSAAGGLMDQLGPISASLTTVNSGVGGNKVAQIEAAVASRITDYSPNVVVLQVGVNDDGHNGSATAPATFRASYDSILSQILTWNPATQIVCVGILCNGELWSGTSFSGNTYDANIALLEAEIAASAAAAGVTYTNLRAPGGLYESINNTGHATSGVLTSDTIHPNATGQIKMGNWTVGSFSIPRDQPLLVSQP